ncbi:MAG: hypothetical protein ABRQ39_11125 [Candidatus Eremiobacterota bacterium]
MMRFLLFLSGVLILFSLHREVISAGEETLKVNLTDKKITVPKELPGAQIIVIKKNGDLPAELLPDNIIIEREGEKQNTSNNIPDDMKDLLSTPNDREAVTGNTVNKTDSNINNITPKNDNTLFILFIFSLLSVIILGIIIIYMKQKQTTFNKGG